MSAMKTVCSASLFDAIADIVYIVDAEGRILAYNTLRWNQFALANEAPELTDETALIGRSLYGFIADDETRGSYRKLAEAILNGSRDVVVLFYRCDAPERRRDMRMAMTAINIGEATRGVLYHSALFQEFQRPAVGFLKRFGATRTNLPMLGICSYCKNVRYPADSSEGEWVTTERYYQLGGTEEVSLSHGICTECYQRIVQPVLDQP